MGEAGRGVEQSGCVKHNVETLVLELQIDGWSELKDLTSVTTGQEKVTDKGGAVGAWPSEDGKGSTTPVTGGTGISCRLGGAMEW